MEVCYTQLPRIKTNVHILCCMWIGTGVMCAGEVAAVRKSESLLLCDSHRVILYSCLRYS